MATKRKSVREVEAERQDSMFPKKNSNNDNFSKKEIALTKKEISKIIEEEGSSARKADSIRFNPILTNALLYWSNFGGEKKSKPDIIEEALLKYIPEEYLIKGYEMTQKN